MKTCYFCKGKVSPSRIDYMAKRDGEYLLVKNVEAEVCEQCGEIYLSPDASRQIDGALSTIDASREHISVPVVHCA